MESSRIWSDTINQLGMISQNYFVMERQREEQDRQTQMNEQLDLLNWKLLQQQSELLEKQLQQTPVVPNSNPSAEEKQHQLKPSVVIFKSSPDGAEITVDGKFIGSSPSSIRLDLGDHQIVIEKPGYIAWKRTMTVKSGSNQTIDTTLEKAQ